ncbi:unnamed protein product [Blepharisma stoltei]|uniref:non-specific serine/threonine protein kinase n=1 Tax=Blepharisma stoltei TaxID=1481888 RepID=A0AAU9JXV0_9CILI|nr:unnamed protein product [Blepharisma stoltei]
MNFSDLQDIVSNYEDPEEMFFLWDKIGEGAYGSVFRGIHKLTGSRVAIKIIPIGDDIESLKTEISIMKQLSHPNIVGYIGSYIKDDELWMIIEYCVAGSVADLIKVNKSPLNEQQISSICQAVLKGLNYLHENNKIHRDIKAANILIDHRGVAKLCDFGVSAHVLNKNSKNDTIIGTPLWMSPEVISKTHYNNKTDIWSLGITAIEMAEGQPPYSHLHPIRVMQAVQRNPAQGLFEPSKWSHEFNDFVHECLRVNFQERPSSKELLNHPFIRNSLGNKILSQLVSNSLANIEKYKNSKQSEIESDNEEIENINESVIVKDFNDSQWGSVASKNEPVNKEFIFSTQVSSRNSIVD